MAVLVSLLGVFVRVAVLVAVHVAVLVAVLVAVAVAVLVEVFVGVAVAVFVAVFVAVAVEVLVAVFVAVRVGVSVPLHGYTKLIELCGLVQETFADISVAATMIYPEKPEAGTTTF